jgi:hypothetical protein
MKIYTNILDEELLQYSFDTSLPPSLTFQPNKTDCDAWFYWWSKLQVLKENH